VAVAELNKGDFLSLAIPPFGRFNIEGERRFIRQGFRQSAESPVIFD
jgi:hypothetical protein